MQSPTMNDLHTWPTFYRLQSLKQEPGTQNLAKKQNRCCRLHSEDCRPLSISSTELEREAQNIHHDSGRRNNHFRGVI